MGKIIEKIKNLLAGKKVNAVRKNSSNEVKKEESRPQSEGPKAEEKPEEQK